MDVTKKNYKEVLVEVKNLLKAAEFISFDLELSGLGRMLGKKNHDLDTPEERYQKAMKRVSEYGLIQIGMSIFRYCKNSEKFLSSTYSFYLSGKHDGSYRYDSASMLFLAENGFDFNKMFLEGLPFIPLVEEETFRKKKEERLTQEKETVAPIKIKEFNAKTFFEEAMKKVTKSKETGESTQFDGGSLNGFLRKVLFTNVAPKFPNSLFKTAVGSNRDIVVTHFETENEKENFIREALEDEISEQLGFTHFVKAILESNLPLVGHNMILDILHFVDKFVAPLPPTLKELKSVFKGNMPTIYDTKVLAKDPPFSGNIVNTSLGCLYKELREKFNPPDFDAEKGHSSYCINGTGQAHDGGFDAFMTGVCFITMLKTLAGKNFRRNSLMKSEKLKFYANKINFMGSYDIPSINLDKPDVIPNRSFIYVVTCPSTWTPMNVKNSFSVLQNYKTVWLSDTQLFVIPQDQKDISKAKARLPMIQASCPPNVKVVMYDANRRKVANGNNVVGGGSNQARTRHSGMKKPSSLPLKRSSDAQEPSSDDLAAQMDSGDASDGASESARQLKRLKSVGSELLSNMTLESPVAHSTEVGDQSMVFDTSEVFPVPDQW